MPVYILQSEPENQSEIIEVVSFEEERIREIRVEIEVVKVVEVPVEVIIIREIKIPQMFEIPIELEIQAKSETGEKSVQTLIEQEVLSLEIVEVPT